MDSLHAKFDEGSYQEKLAQAPEEQFRGKPRCRERHPIIPIKVRQRRQAVHRQTSGAQLGTRPKLKDYTSFVFVFLKRLPGSQKSHYPRGFLGGVRHTVWVTTVRVATVRVTTVRVTTVRATTVRVTTVRVKNRSGSNCSDNNRSGNNPSGNNLLAR